MLLANTFFQHNAEELATYYEISATPIQDVQENKFAQLDYIVCPRNAIGSINNIGSNRYLPLFSHHFMVTCELKTPAILPKHCKSPTMPKRDYSELENAMTSQNIIDHFIANTTDCNTMANVNDVVCNLNDAIRTGATTFLPDVQMQPNKPWVSDTVMKLIDERKIFRLHGNYDDEKNVQKQIRKELKDDKQKWIESTLEDGNWNAIKRFKGIQNKKSNYNFVMKTVTLYIRLTKLMRWQFITKQCSGMYDQVAVLTTSL